MAITDLYNKTVNTKRLGDVEGTKKQIWQDVLADLPCTIHPVETQQQALGDGAFYKTYKMWCDLGTDILAGDRVILDDETYTVQGVSKYDFGRNNHLRVTLALGA